MLYRNDRAVSVAVLVEFWPQVIFNTVFMKA